MSQSQSQSQPSADPRPAAEAGGVAEAGVAAPTDAQPAEPDVPLNRAARRAKAKQTDPSHVGPRAGATPSTRGPRSHTKRQIS